MKAYVACLLFCAIWIIVYDNVHLVKAEDTLAKMQAGIYYVNKYLETAKNITDLVKNITDLVSKSLGHKQKQKQGEDKQDDAKQSFGPSNLISAFSRLVGFDPPKIAAIAVNGVIFLAQMISLLFGLKPSQGNIARNMNDKERAWDPLRFILENKNEKIQNLVEQAKDANLPNQLIAGISGSDSACIRLLLCKSSIVIRAAQNSLDNKSHSDAYQLIAWLPSKEEFEMNSDDCDDQHTDCSLFSSR